MKRTEIDPIRDRTASGLTVDELEARLEMQNATFHANALWACAPVDVCETACGGGALCEDNCACFGMCACDGVHI